LGAFFHSQRFKASKTQPEATGKAGSALREISGGDKVMTIQKLYSIFGSREVFIPIPRGKKRPPDEGWQKITFADTQDPEYQRRLAFHVEQANVGVRQGEDLQSIDLDDDQLVEPFLAQNPFLRATTMTKAKRGCQFHLRVKGDYPNSQAVYKLAHKTKLGSDGKPLKLMEWRCGGGGKGSQSIVSGVHPEGVRYWCNEKPVLEIEFDQIKWPDCVTLPWKSEAPPQAQPLYTQPAAERAGSVRLVSGDLLKRLTAKFKPPCRFNKSGEAVKFNERFFAELMKVENHIIHEANEERFYLYNPTTGLWERTNTHSLKSKLSDRIRQAEAEWRLPLVTLDTEYNRRNTISLLRGIVEERDFFRNRPHATHAANCMLVFENRAIVEKPFAPKFLSRNQLSVSYQPGAICPRFQKELLEPALSADDLASIKKMFGLLVLGRNRPQRIFVLIGGGNTGKTTTGLVAADLIGQENYTELRTAQLDSRFELARLVGKILVFGADVAANFLMTAGAHRLKSLVGGDPLVAERKNSNEPFPFKGDLNVLITANEDLLVRLHGDFDRTAWERRLLPISFNRDPIKLRIPFFNKILLAEEGSGILNFALAGLLDYYQDEALRGDLILSEEQTERIEKLLTQSEGFRNFISRELVAADGDEISVEELIEAYAVHAKGQKWRIPKRQTLQEQAQELMLEIWGIARSNSVERDGKNVRGYRGIRLRGENENDPEI
jgi:phage/plasmid-associated DNA primase